jgi:hypothetical protein
VQMTRAIACREPTLARSVALLPRTRPDHFEVGAGNSTVVITKEATAHPGHLPARLRLRAEPQQLADSGEEAAHGATLLPASRARR